MKSLLHYLILACLTARSLPAADSTSLVPTSSIPLPGVSGRFDHFALDARQHRLFAAALGNNTLEILDVQAAKRLHTIKGLKKPTGVLFLPDSGEIVVANGDDGTCRFYDGATYDLKATVNKVDDADNLRFDAKDGLIYLGYGDGTLGVINPKTHQLIASIPLKGHPEAFQLESNGPRIFVNVPDAGHVAVVDREKRAVIATWPLNEFKANFPMAFDEAHQRLFIGCRHPARLVVLDTQDGRRVADVASSGDTDDLFYDAARKRIYVSCGEGFLNIIEQTNADAYQLRERIATSSGARTCFFDAKSGQLFLAVPARGKQGAEVRVYHAQP